MVLVAAALLVFAVWLVANGRKATVSRRRGVRFGAVVVAVAVANIAVLIAAHNEHDEAAQLLSLATSLTLVGVLHFWAAGLRVRQQHRGRPKDDGWNHGG